MYLSCNISPNLKGKIGGRRIMYEDVFFMTIKYRKGEENNYVSI